ncbi:MAG TPA: D-glycero-beta-D-manno-heptose 1-phosphate adenylyltransferase [Bacteroidales bacterium]|nr:D-glycero-beta-D-manno-heptose 1-phosphate adenylyltransferase [Bacteroidales bacterium]
MKFPIQEKIITRSQFETLKPSLSDQKIVFTNGCFDIIHLGHIQYLAQARELGDLLVVGLNTDLSVKRLKGESRPVNPEFARAMVLAALQFVDFVILFDEDTPLNLIHTISPDFLVKGGDYSIDQIVGADFVIEKGGKVITLPFVEGFSSSNIIQNTNP